MFTLRDLITEDIRTKIGTNFAKAIENKDELFFHNEIQLLRINSRFTTDTYETYTDTFYGNYIPLIYITAYDGYKDMNYKLSELATLVYNYLFAFNKDIPFANDYYLTSNKIDDMIDKYTIKVEDNKIMLIYMENQNIANQYNPILQSICIEYIEDRLEFIFTGYKAIKAINDRKYFITTYSEFCRFLLNNIRKNTISKYNDYDYKLKMLTQSFIDVTKNNMNKMLTCNASIPFKERYIGDGDGVAYIIDADYRDADGNDVKFKYVENTTTLRSYIPKVEIYPDGSYILNSSTTYTRKYDVENDEYKFYLNENSDPIAVGDITGDITADIIDADYIDINGNDVAFKYDDGGSSLPYISEVVDYPDGIANINKNGITFNVSRRKYTVNEGAVNEATQYIYEYDKVYGLDKIMSVEIGKDKVSVDSDEIVMSVMITSGDATPAEYYGLLDYSTDEDDNITPIKWGYFVNKVDGVATTQVEFFPSELNIGKYKILENTDIDPDANNEAEGNGDTNGCTCDCTCTCYNCTKARELKNHNQDLPTQDDDNVIVNESGNWDDGYPVYWVKDELYFSALDIDLLQNNINKVISNGYLDGDVHGNFIKLPIINETTGYPDTDDDGNIKNKLCKVLEINDPNNLLGDITDENDNPTSDKMENLLETTAKSYVQASKVFMYNRQMSSNDIIDLRLFATEFDLGVISYYTIIKELKNYINKEQNLI